MKYEYEQKEEKKNKNQKWWRNRKNRIYDDANTQTHADIAWIEKKQHNVHQLNLNYAKE